MVCPIGPNDEVYSRFIDRPASHINVAWVDQGGGAMRPYRGRRSFERLIANVAASKVENMAGACLTALPGLTGAVFTAMGGLDQRDTRSVAGATGPQTERLQFLLGEGPCADAYTSGRPVLAPNLASLASERQWPAFAPAAKAAGVHAMFGFPLSIGAIRIGVLDLSRDNSGPLDDDEFALALALADAASVVLVTDDPDTGGVPVHRAQVHQASGMITVQLGVDIGTALARLRARAYAESRAVEELAADVVERRVRFDEPDQQNDGTSGRGGLHVT